LSHNLQFNDFIFNHSIDKIAHWEHPTRAFIHVCIWLSTQSQFGSSFIFQLCSMWPHQPCSVLTRLRFCLGSSNPFGLRWVHYELFIRHWYIGPRFYTRQMCDCFTKVPLTLISIHSELFSIIDRAMRFLYFGHHK